jgi:hypothetical protein
LVADGRNGLGNQPPRTIGSSASALLKYVDGSHYQAKITPQEWRTLWLWIESGAPYAGTYAALRNGKEQTSAGLALTRVFREQGTVLQRRCFGCHNNPDTQVSKDYQLPFNWEARRRSKRSLNRPTASHERIIFENDPIARFSANILFNFTRPHLSPLLLGPLAKDAGGFGSCGQVFKDTQDPDYKQLRTALVKGAAQWDNQPRYATPGFKPNRQYVREMKKYGVLPPAFDLAKDTLDVFETDQAYWRSLWLTPASTKN